MTPRSMTRRIVLEFAPRRIGSRPRHGRFRIGLPPPCDCGALRGGASDRPAFSDQRPGGRQYRSPEGRADRDRDLRRDPRQRRHQGGPAAPQSGARGQDRPRCGSARQPDGRATRSTLRGAALLAAAWLISSNAPIPAAPRPGGPGPTDGRGFRIWRPVCPTASIAQRIARRSRPSSARVASMIPTTASKGPGGGRGFFRTARLARATAMGQRVQRRDLG